MNKNQDIKDWILDHPKLAGFFAAIALAAAFSPRASPIASWVFISVAAAFAIAMLFGFSKKRNWRKTRLAISCVIAAGALFGFGYWLTNAKEQKPATAKEIADAISKNQTEEMRSHLVIMGYRFPKELSSNKPMQAYYRYKNIGELDAQSQFPWRVAVDEVFLDDPEKQRKVEDRLFEAMLVAPRNCPTLDVAIQSEQYQAVPLPLGKPQIDAINSGEGAIYVVGRLKYWDKNGEHHTDFCSFLAKGQFIGDCKGHNQAP